VDDPFEFLVEFCEGRHGSLSYPGLQPDCRIARKQVRFRVLCECHLLVKARADIVSLTLLLRS